MNTQRNQSSDHKPEPANKTSHPAPVEDEPNSVQRGQCAGHKKASVTIRGNSSAVKSKPAAPLKFIKKIKKNSQPIIPPIAPPIASPIVPPIAPPITSPIAQPIAQPAQLIVQLNKFNLEGTEHTFWFGRSAKGGTCLYIDGHKYHRKKTRVNREGVCVTNWICATKGCKVSAKSNETQPIVLSNLPHGHSELHEEEEELDEDVSSFVFGLFGF